MNENINKRALQFLIAIMHLVDQDQTFNKNIIYYFFHEIIKLTQWEIGICCSVDKNNHIIIEEISCLKEENQELTKYLYNLDLNNNENSVKKALISGHTHWNNHESNIIDKNFKFFSRYNLQGDYVLPIYDNNRVINIFQFIYSYDFTEYINIIDLIETSSEFIHNLIAQKQQNNKLNDIQEKLHEIELANSNLDKKSLDQQHNFFKNAHLSAEIIQKTAPQVIHVLNGFKASIHEWNDILNMIEDMPLYNDINSAKVATNIHHCNEILSEKKLNLIKENLLNMLNLSDNMLHYLDNILNKKYGS